METVSFYTPFLALGGPPRGPWGPSLAYLWLWDPFFPGCPRSFIYLLRDLILYLTARRIQKAHPQLHVSWEILDFDAPATVEATLLNGYVHRSAHGLGFRVEGLGFNTHVG